MSRNRDPGIDLTSLSCSLVETSPDLCFLGPPVLVNSSSVSHYTTTTHAYLKAGRNRVLLLMSWPYGREGRGIVFGPRMS